MPELELTRPPLGGWFCVRTQPKHEHIAAGHLRKLPRVEVFLPRLRFRRRTRRGAVWFTEALFPNYLFARFEWPTQLRQVMHTAGVRAVVHFGERWPTVADSVMAELRSLFGDAQIHEIPAAPEVGEAVKIVGGVLHGWSALVTQTMPARERVTVLLELLGQQTAVELPLDQVVREECRSDPFHLRPV